MKAINTYVIFAKMIMNIFQSIYNDFVKYLENE